MFVNAADADHGAEVRRAYVSILADCTSLDARILSTLHAAEPGLLGRPVVGAFLPDRLIVTDDEFEERLPSDLTRSLWNLRRLGLVASYVRVEPTDDKPDIEIAMVGITTLGLGLVEACTLRDPNAPKEFAESTG